MAKCETCGNEYDKAFKLRTARSIRSTASNARSTHLRRPAPSAASGLSFTDQKSGKSHCCAHCAEAQGATELRDRAW